VETQRFVEEERLPDFLFNLANSDRLRLLSEAAVKKQKMSSLSRAIGASTPECSRHLTRLMDSGLIRKDTSGLYEATPVGVTVLRLLPGFEVMVRYREYFATHDLGALPGKFVGMIGALSDADHVSHFGAVLDRIKSTISEAEVSSLLLVDKPILVGKGGLGSGSPNSRARFIFSRALGQADLVAVKTAFPHSEVATATEVKIALGVTEKSAGIIFPFTGGGPDFGNGFFGKSQSFRDWCSDLFEYYWKGSRKVYFPSPFSGRSGP
jgi:predicted transcriptional regulator